MFHVGNSRPEKENTLTFALLDISQPFNPLTIESPATIINGLSSLSLVQSTEALNGAPPPPQ